MSIPTYQKVMSNWDVIEPTMAAETKDLLSHWRGNSTLGIRIVDNLKNDYKISETIMAEMLTTLHSGRHLTFEELEAGIFRKLCYKYSLKGPQIDLGKVSDKIGGAKTADEFIFALGARIRFGGTTKAREIVSKLCSDTEHLTPAEKDVHFCDHGTWVTWSEVTTSNPFDFVSTPDEILKVIINLGLAHRQEGMSHLLFVYSKDRLTELHFPTIADANLYSYFKCTDCEDYCGRTQPWNPEEIEHRKIEKIAVKPRPEGVHKPIKLGEIDKPVRVIKGTVGTYYLS